MFNIFGNSGKPKEYMVPMIDEIAQPVPKITSSEIKDSHYSVGVNDQGLTQLKLFDGNTTTTLTLTQDGVNQMIRLLSATLPECCGCDDHE